MAGIPVIPAGAPPLEALARQRKRTNNLISRSGEDRFYSMGVREYHHNVVLHPFRAEAHDVTCSNAMIGQSILDEGEGRSISVKSWRSAYQKCFPWC